MPHAILIANPASGRGEAPHMAKQAAVQLHAGGWTSEILTTQSPGHASSLAQEIDHATVVLSVGGDGTLYEILNGLIAGGKELNIATLPAGSGNSLALDLKLSSPEEAVQRVLARTVRPLDVIRATLDGTIHHAVNVIGWGAAARITRRSENLRWARGLRYDLATLAEILRPRIIPGATTVDGSRDARELLGVAAITQHSGRGMCVAPPARLDDGLLDVVTIRRSWRPRLIALLGRVHAGNHLSSNLVTHRQASRLDLYLGDDSGVVIDGEWMPGRELSLEVLPRKALLWA